MGAFALVDSARDQRWPCVYKSARSLLSVAGMPGFLNQRGAVAVAGRAGERGCLQEFRGQRYGSTGQPAAHQ